MNLTPHELEIMDIFWENGRPLSRGDILNSTSKKTWKPSSIHILLNSLISKKAIRECGFTKCGKTIGRVYAPTVTVEEYYVGLLTNTRKKPDLQKLINAYKAKYPESDK